MIQLAYVMFEETIIFLKAEHQSNFYGKIPHNPE
jgi:hypothetical protein